MIELCGRSLGWFCWGVKPDWTLSLPHHLEPEILQYLKFDFNVGWVSLGECKNKSSLEKNSTINNTYPESNTIQCQISNPVCVHYPMFMSNSELNQFLSKFKLNWIVLGIDQGYWVKGATRVLTMGSQGLKMR